MGATADIDQLPRRPAYRSEYEALGRQGAFDDESVELLDGRIVYSADEGPPHADMATRLARLFIESIPAEPSGRSHPSRPSATGS